MTDLLVPDLQQLHVHVHHLIVEPRLRSKTLWVVFAAAFVSCINNTHDNAWLDVQVDAVQYVNGLEVNALEISL